MPSFDIAFDLGLAGLVAIDESTYASTRGHGLPDSDEFDAYDFAMLPWPVWKEESSPRAALYGDLGGLCVHRQRKAQRRERTQDEGVIGRPEMQTDLDAP